MFRNRRKKAFILLLVNVLVLSTPIESSRRVFGDTRKLNSQEKFIESREESPLNSDEIIASGSMGSGTSSWSLTSEGILSITAGSYIYTGNVPWLNYRDRINKVIFEGPVQAGESLASLFASLNAEIINLNYLDTSNVSDMSQMFDGFSSAQGIDISNFDTSKVTNMCSMFANSSLPELDLSNFNTSKVTDMSHMFANTSLTNLDLSNFDTSSVTNMHCMFERNPFLTNVEVGSFNTSNVTDMSGMFGFTPFTYLDLSNFDTSNVTNMSYMFAFTDLTNLDLSNFDTSNVNNMIRMLRSDSLKKFTLGTKFKKFNDLGYDILSNIEKNDKYTGYWQNIGTGSTDYPRGQNVWTSEEFVQNYNGVTDADTYVWQPYAVAGGDVTATYVDTAGKKISEDVVKSGNIGEDYRTEQKAIEGYTFKEVQGNPTGQFTDQAQTVTYVYTKNPVKAADVTVNYMDEDGKTIPNVSAQIISGNVGDFYDATTDVYKLTIDGYTLDESKLPANAKGTLSNQAQTVTYVYFKNKKPNVTGSVLVNYVDTDGNKISEDVVKSGTVGESYKTEKKDIKGYAFKEVQGNTAGQFTEQVQIVTYVYIKNKVNPVNPEPKPENKPGSKDKNNNQGRTSSEQHGLPATGENERMKMLSVGTGMIFLVAALMATVFRFKRFKNNK